MKLNCHSKCFLSTLALIRYKALKFYSQVVSYLGLTCLPTRSQLDRGSARGRGPTREGKRHWRLKKNDRDANTLTTGKSLRVLFPRRSTPGKIWNPTNQIRAIRAPARVYHEVRTRAPQALGVYKESRVASRAQAKLLVVIITLHISYSQQPSPSSQVSTTPLHLPQDIGRCCSRQGHPQQCQ